MSRSLYENGAPTVTGVERDIVDAVSTDVPWDVVERFAGLERVSGTDDELEAAAYLADRLEGFGVDHEVFTPELYLSTPHGAGIETEGGWASETAKTVAFSKDGQATGELVYVENESEMDSIEAMLSVSLDGLESDLSGKVVMSESIIPISAIEELAERGAEAFVGIHPHEREPHEGIVTPVWGGARPRRAGPDPGVARRQRLRERGTGTAGTGRAGDRGDGHGRDDNGVDARAARTRTHPGRGCAEERRVRLGPRPSRLVARRRHRQRDGDATLLELARVLDAHREQLRRDVWVAWWPGHSRVDTPDRRGSPTSSHRNSHSAVSPTSTSTPQASPTRRSTTSA